MNIILGVDPGSQFTGFGAIKTDGQRIDLVSFGIIAPPAGLEFNHRVAVIADEIEKLVQRLCPKETVIEKVFLGKNADSAFKLGHVRGAIIAAVIRHGSDVVEYATRSVKKGITGNGGASKEQVQMILFSALGLRGQVQADASDALALAFYHARQKQIQSNLLRGAVVKGGRRPDMGSGEGVP